MLTDNRILVLHSNIIKIFLKKLDKLKVLGTITTLIDTLADLAVNKFIHYQEKCKANACIIHIYLLFIFICQKKSGLYKLHFLQENMTLSS